MNTAIAFKVQLNDKVKMIAQNTYENVAALITAAKASYPKRLEGTEIALKYSDNDGDWIYLSEDDDLAALIETANSIKDKKVKLFIEITKDKVKPQAKKAQQKKVAQQVDEVKKALEATTLEDKVDEPAQEEEKKVEFKDLKDFKFADLATQIEALLNSEEPVRPRMIFRALREATEGTKAEVHVKRMLKHRRRCHSKPGKHWKKMKKCQQERSSSRDLSSSPEGHKKPFFGAEHLPFLGFGPMAHPYAHPHFGPHAGFGPRGHGGKRHAMKFFKKFMKAYRSSSSSSSPSSSSEERQLRRQQRKEENQKRRQERIQQREAAKAQKVAETADKSME